FLNNAQRIIRDAVPARDLLAVRGNPRHFSDRWVAAAVYAVPDADETFYQFGSSVLGYDLRDGTVVPPPRDAEGLDLHRYVGEAGGFGLHLTIADALYFA